MTYMGGRPWAPGDQGLEVEVRAGATEDCWGLLSFFVS